MWVLFKELGSAALPVAGGLYDQHPKLVDSWHFIAQEEAKHQHKERIKDERKARQSGRRKR